MTEELEPPAPMNYETFHWAAVLHLAQSLEEGCKLLLVPTGKILVASVLYKKPQSLYTFYNLSQIEHGINLG
jgi:hypothetical protein